MNTDSKDNEANTEPKPEGSDTASKHKPLDTLSTESDIDKMDIASNRSITKTDDAVSHKTEGDASKSTSDYTGSDKKDADMISISSTLSSKESDTISVRSKLSELSTTSGVSSKLSTDSVIHGVICTPCFRQNEKVDAVKYCVDCVENYCKPCLRKHIKSFSRKGHKLVGKDEMPDFMNTTSGDNGNGIDKCPRHADLDMDNYCEHHQILCCDKCAYLEHGACDHIIDLITATRELDLDKEIAQMQDKVMTLIDNLVISKSERQEYRIRMRTNTAQSLNVIREFRIRINDIFDRLERQPIDVINSTCLEEDNQANKDIKEVDTVLAQLQESNRKLRTNKSNNIAKFAVLQKAKLIVKRTEGLAISKINSKNTNVFVINKMVEESVRNIKSIGDFRSSVHSKAQLSFLEYLPIAYSGSEKSQNVEIGENTPGSLKVDACEITGVTLLADGKLVITDNENKDLKLFTSELTFARKLRLGRDSDDVSEPYGVCRTGDYQVAVTLEKDKLIDIVDLNDMDTLVHTEIEVGEYCRGLAYSFLYDELFVACGGGSYKDEGLGHIRVFDLQGNHLRSLKRSPSTGNLLLPHPLNIAMSQDGARIYVTDCDKGIVTLDRHGQFVQYVSSPVLLKPWGISVLTVGRVIVTCQQSRDLAQVSEDGKELKVLKFGTKLPYNPKAVCYDERKSRIFVSFESMNEIGVFSVI